MSDTTVDANSSEVLSDVPSIPLLVDLSAPATDDSIPSSASIRYAQQPPAPHSSSTSGSIHPMVMVPGDHEHSLQCSPLLTPFLSHMPPC